jgi:hypothetical protein
LLSLRCLYFSVDLEEERRCEVCYREPLSFRLLVFLFLLFILKPNHDDIFYPLDFIFTNPFSIPSKEVGGGSGEVRREEGSGAVV